MNVHMRPVPPPDENTYVTELGIDAEEEALGAISGRVIRWHLTTIYLLRTNDGLSVWGAYVHRDSDIARAIARRKSLDNIRLLRSRRTQPPIAARTRA